jgi:hypothetical protein
MASLPMTSRPQAVSRAAHRRSHQRAGDQAAQPRGRLVPDVQPPEVGEHVLVQPGQAAVPDLSRPCHVSPPPGQYVVQHGLERIVEPAGRRPVEGVVRQVLVEVLGHGAQDRHRPLQLAQRAGHRPVTVVVVGHLPPDDLGHLLAYAPDRGGRQPDAVRGSRLADRVDDHRQVRLRGDGMQQVDQHLRVGLGIPGLGDVARADRREHEQAVHPQVSGVPCGPRRSRSGDVHHAGQHRAPAAGLFQHDPDHPSAFLAVQREQLASLGVGDHGHARPHSLRREKAAHERSVRDLINLVVSTERQHRSDE